MVNVTVINRKDCVKYLVRLILAIAIVGVFTRYFSIIKKSKIYAKDNENISLNKQVMLTECLEETIPTIGQMCNKDDKKNKEVISIRKLAMDQELGAMNFLEKKQNKNTKENKLEEDQSSISSEIEVKKTDDKENIDKSNNIDLAQVGVKTEVQPSDVPNKYTNTYNDVLIKNESEKDIEENTINPEGMEVNKKNILIFHTHTCESYTPTDKNNYEQSGNFRTTDLKYSVSKVGDELENQLKSYGFNVIHNKDYHDYPAYTGSYERSLNTVSNILNTNENIDIVFDIHRDAIADSTYAPTVKIGDEYAAQIMFVIGTNGSGLDHPNWEQNLKFAVKVQQKANEMYPGLFKPIIVRDSRYNQNLAKAASIIEVGATGNTLEEACCSMKYFARVLSEL